MYTPVLEEPSPLPLAHGRRVQKAAVAAVVGGMSSYPRGGSGSDPIHGSELLTYVGIVASASAGGIMPKPVQG